MGFTAAQIPFIAGRKYPPKLAGKLYPKGIPIYSEEKIPQLIKKYGVDEVVFSYSDVSHEHVMHLASLALSLGASFKLLGPKDSMLKSRKPLIAVCATRTGAGKSTTSRKVVEILSSLGKKVVVIRHPMPYGKLAKQAVQRFSTIEDLKRQECTLEETEEYYPYVEKGIVVYAGIDCEKILRKAEKEADVLVFDGGNNDLPLIKPDLHVVVTDATRAGQELLYHPGETNLRMADVVVITKVELADQKAVKSIVKNIKKVNKKAAIIKAAMPISVDKPQLIKGKRVLVIEDAPTVTHGELAFGAATLAAKKLGASRVDPREKARGSLKQVYAQYPRLRKILPTMGYSKKQLKELEKVIDEVKCDCVLVGSPADLTKFLKISKPVVRVSYELKEVGKPDLRDVLTSFLAKI